MVPIRNRDLNDERLMENETCRDPAAASEFKFKFEVVCPRFFKVGRGVGHG